MRDLGVYCLLKYLSATLIWK